MRKPSKIWSSGVGSFVVTDGFCLSLAVPKENVATIKKSASVIEGVSRVRNALLNGETTKYDWDSGYTCHQLGSGAVVVQLGQPYIIDSMRLLLWDCDERWYSYYIEISCNGWEWEMVADRTRENCKSWQTISFERRPVVFIRITGTHNTANEVFHCVHFECPAQTDLPGSLCQIMTGPRLSASKNSGESEVNMVLRMSLVYIKLQPPLFHHNLLVCCFSASKLFLSQSPHATPREIPT